MFQRKFTWRQIWEDTVIPTMLLICALISVLTTAGIIFILLLEAFSFFREVPLWDFLTGTQWIVTTNENLNQYGILPLITGTFMVTLGAALVALPIGLASAVYLSEYAPERVRSVVKPVLEVLAGIPTIVYGYFAITMITPLLRSIFPKIDFFNALSASIAVGIMIIPMVASLSEDAMRSVPSRLREGAYGLGATRFEVSWNIVIPAALSGIIASFVLALSRAFGETMIVAIAAGATPNLSFNFFESIQTMTAFIVQIANGDISANSISYLSIYAVGITLFIFTFLFNLIAEYVTRRFKEEY